MRAQESIARAFFMRADVSRKGALDPREFHAVLRDMRFEMPYSEALRLFGEVDRNRNGKISEREFVDWYTEAVAGGGGGEADMMGRSPGSVGMGMPGMPPMAMGATGLGMGRNLTEEHNQRNMATACFYEHDQDRNGFLSEREFLNAIRWLGIPVSPDEALDWFAGADKKRDGVICIDEFVLFFMEMCATRKATFFAMHGPNPGAMAGPGAGPMGANLGAMGAPGAIPIPGPMGVPAGMGGQMPQGGHGGMPGMPGRMPMGMGPPGMGMGGIGDRGGPTY